MLSDRTPRLVPIFFGLLALVTLLLSVQLPFLYYSDDIVFHAAKIMAARDGDFFTDPVTGFKTIYPPFYHMIAGGMAGLFDLSSFQTSRLIQVFQVLGLFLAGFFFFGRFLRSRDQTATAGLLLILLLYAPTGRYWLLANPFTFSFPLVLTGMALLIDWRRRGALGRGLAGALLCGIGISIWWWNMIPVIGMAAGLLVLPRAQSGRSRQRTEALLIGGVLAVALAANLWPLWSVREILPDYRGFSRHAGYVAQHDLLRSLGEWAGGFLLKGNAQFFKYLYPEAWSSPNRLVVIYGLFASVYYYLLVLPINGLLLVTSVREGLRRARAGLRDESFAMLVAASVTFLLSLATLFQTNSSITRRVQFYCYLFLVPAFLIFWWDRLHLDRNAIRRWSLAVVCGGAMLYSVVYRFDLTLTDPISPATAEVAAFVKALPGHADRRIFVTQYDNHRLLRTARYRSFLLRGNPTYFQQDKVRADSIETAYTRIIEGGPAAEDQLREFGTEFAIVGKTSAGISPVMNQEGSDPAREHVTAYFRRYAEPVLENAEWVVFRLEYPFRDHSGEPEGPVAASGGTKQLDRYAASGLY